MEAWTGSFSAEIMGADALQEYTSRAVNAHSMQFIKPEWNWSESSWSTRNFDVSLSAQLFCSSELFYLCSTTHQYKHSQWLFPQAVYFYVFSLPVCLIDARVSCYRQLKIWQDCLRGHCCKLSKGLSELFSSVTGRGSCKSCKKSSEILWCGCDKHRNRPWLCLHLLFPISIPVASILWTEERILCVVRNSQNP